MRTRLRPFDDHSIHAASDVLTSGHVVAVPTETVYGLAADATSASAVAEIFAAKGRPACNPLIVHVATLDQALAIGIFSATARHLAQSHWPGPLTLVVPLRADARIAPDAVAGLATVAIRIPSHRAMRALLDVTGLPLAAPSANASGTISSTCAEHVMRTLDGKIPLVIDDGPTSGGIESTIVKVEGDTVTLLRHGPVLIDDAVANSFDGIEAPGQLSAHYAPSKPLRLDAMSSADDEWHVGFGPIAGTISLSPVGNLEEAAANLFAALHTADLSAASRIAFAPIPEIGVGRAINDRLRRAAAGTR